MNPLLKLRQGFVRYEPLGVVAVISPWNYPLLLAMQHIVPAVLCGNAVIHKPSEFTTLTGLKIKEIFDRAGLPQHVLSVVGGLVDVGRALTNSSINKIFFTGSTEVGIRIYMDAASRLVPVNMELGGSDPMIVLEDAPLARTARGAVWGAFCNAGQTCVSFERVLVHESIYKAFIEEMVTQVDQLEFGTSDPAHGDIGSMVNEAQLKKIQNLVDDARQKGAKIHCGGKARTDMGDLYYEPTIISEVDDSMLLTKQEIFGPVVSVQSFGSDEEALELANKTEFGLSATIWTNNRKRGLRLAEGIAAGSVLVNDGLSHLAQFEAPYTGYKNSGVGVGHGRWGVMEMVHPKYISQDRKWITNFLRIFLPALAHRNAWWFKYGSQAVADMKSFAQFLHGRTLLDRISAAPRALRALCRKRNVG